LAYPAADSPDPIDAVSDKTIISSADLARIVDRIAHQILEKTDGARDTMLLGIPTRGVPLARRLASRIRSFESVEVPVGALDVTLYRDDLRLRGARAVGPTDLPRGGVDARRVILVDDVLFSGRTIRADYVGKNIPTSVDESVRVLLVETDGVDEIRITGKEQS